MESERSKNGERMRICLKILSFCLLLLTGGCAVLFQDNLDRAYQSGNLSAAEYYSLKAQQGEARRQTMLIRQQQQNAVMSQYMQTMTITPAPTFSTPVFAPQRSGLGGGFGAGSAPSESEPNLPSGMAIDQIRNGQGATTGRTRLASDGVLWQEYRAFDGTLFWTRSR